MHAGLINQGMKSTCRPNVDWIDCKMRVRVPRLNDHHNIDDLAGEATDGHGRPKSQIARFVRKMQRTKNNTSEY
jgi:hypothetical protein